MKGWLFPQVLAIAKRWLDECVTCKDNTFPQLLLLIEFAHDAADRIYKAIVESAAGTPALKPILRPYDVVGSTRYVDFDTTKAVYPTAPDKCHISHKVTTARALWVPAVNNHGGFGRWAFVEVTDPWDAQRTLRAAMQAVGASAC